MVERERERELQTGGDAEAGCGTAFERPSAERVFEPRTNRVEVDAELGQRLGVDLRGARVVREPASEGRLDGPDAHAELGEHRYGSALGGAGEHGEDVLGADVGVAEP